MSSTIQFSPGEKIILSVLQDICEKLGINTEIDLDIVLDAICGGHHWAIEWEHSGLFPERLVSQQTVSEVVDILDMWSFIEEAYSSFSPEQKKYVATKAKAFGNHVVFPGFDGNNESEQFAVARFLVKKLKQFTMFAKRELNSHSPVIASYKRMLNVFEPIRKTLVDKKLSPAQVVSLMDARVIR